MNESPKMHIVDICEDACVDTIIEKITTKLEKQVESSVDNLYREEVKVMDNYDRNVIVEEILEALRKKELTIREAECVLDSAKNELTNTRL